MTPFPCLPRAFVLCAISFVTAFVAASVAETTAAQGIAGFSPQGEVKGVRQASARFATPMVPFGDPREPAPFTVDCAAPGKGRWVDPRNWVYDFDADLPAGLRCTFAAREGLADFAGNALPAGKAFRFDTGGPAILQSLPDEGDNVDERQLFVLGLDAPARPETVAAHAWCEAAGINERIGVRIVAGDERRQVLDARRSFIDRYLRVLLLDPVEGRTRSLDFRLPAKGTDRTRFLALRDASDSPLLVLACARTLPAGAKMKLVWGKGIATSSGVASSADQALAFEVRPAFRATFTCPRANKDAQCIPVLPMQLAFSARIRIADAKAIRLVDADGKQWPAKPASSDGDDWVDAVSFDAVLPEMHAFRIELPAALRDDAGRTLVNAHSFPLKVRTDQSPPIVKFAADFGILESRAGKSGPLLPVTVRNVETPLRGNQKSIPTATGGNDTKPIAGRVARIGAGDEMKIVDWLARIAANDSIDAEFDSDHERWIIHNTGAARTIFKPTDAGSAIEVPKPLGRKAFEVVGIPLKTPGYYVVELASPRLGAALFGVARPYYARTSVLVTNLGVHFKLGRESSLAWITHLDSGAPVAGAEVRVLDCAGNVHWQGKSDASGIARIATELPEVSSLPKCDGDQRRAYFVVARERGDMAFAFSDWDAGIAAWRYNLPTGNYRGPFVASAVFDRTLVRAGDRVSIKAFVRRTTGDGLALTDAGSLDSTLSIAHQGSDRKFTVPVSWSGARYGVAQFDVPKDAPLGTYVVTLRGDRLPGAADRYGSTRELGSFRVEQFRVPLMRARLQPAGGSFVNPQSVTLDTQVAYLSGGAASGLPVKLRTLLRDRAVAFGDYDDYRFAAGDVREGRVESGVSDEEDDGEGGSDDEDGARGASADGAVSETDVTLDTSGGARTVVAKIPASAHARDLVAEIEYRDPNGETLTSATRVPLWSSDIVLGLKGETWSASRTHVKFDVVALDTRGRPQPNVHVDVDAFKRETFSHRRRLIGGFYAYQHGSETRRLSAVCSGDTDAHGILACDGKPPAAGDLILRAKAQDVAGNPAVTRIGVFVPGADDWWYEAGDNDRIDVLPDKKSYQPGEIAHLQVRMPFARAQALVTVEREGILDAFVTEITREHPTLDVPVKGNHAPNVFVSVFVVRGRVDGIAPSALIDLAKPSFKMGIAELRVGWSAHALDVKVTPDQPVYRTRGSAAIDIVVRRADGSAPPPGTDVAIAAVDEGLLEMLPNDSWKLLDAMMTRRGIEVGTSTAQMQVIGRRHFGRKALAAGGGGGRQSARELFDTLLLWRASVTVDAEGHARIDIPLNDSLTGFRIVAIADGGAQWFGTGAASIRTTQPLMLLSGLPQVVREGDRFRAGFTVRNASAGTQRVRASASVTAQAGPALPAILPLAFELAAGATREIGWDVDVPTNAGTLTWRVDATAVSEAETFSDALTVRVTTEPSVPARTVQATILQLDKPATIDVARPADALAGRGGIDVTVQSHLADALPGVDEYLRNYRYSCFEQRASVAIGLHDRERWDALMRALPAFLDDDGLVKYFAFVTQGDDVLTAYALSIADEAGYVIPADLRTRMEAGLIGFVEGRIVRHGALPTVDLAIRKLAALEALSRRKAAFSPQWLDSIVIEPNLWPTSALIDWYSIVKRVPSLPKRDERAAEARQILRARLNLQGTTMNFSTEKSDALWWLMVSGDVNANRLLLAMRDEPSWREDMPRIARGALGRMQRGHWNTTVANAWGVVALDKFSAAFESTPVTGTTTATLAGKTFAQAFSGGEANAHFTQRLAWPATSSPLALAHAGAGSPWVTVASVAAIPIKTPLSTGYTITRRVMPLQQKKPGQWSVGDIARVSIDVDAQSDMTWVVVSDPVPAGAAILGRGFGNESTIATRGEQRDAQYDTPSWPAFEERDATAFNAYYRYVPKGKFSIDYTLRLNNAGTFALPGTHVEAMYAPEMFGELPLSQWKVAP